MKNQLKFALFLIAVYVTIFPAHAHAYLDPGTGSYIIQVLAAVLFAGLFMVKSFWTNIRNFISKIFGRKEAHNSEKSSKK